MDQQTIIGFLFLVFGGLNVLRPDIMVRFQVWSQRVIMGAHLIPGESTQNANRVFGVFFFLLGLLLVTKVLQ